MKKTLKIVGFVLFLIASMAFGGLLVTTLALDAYHGVIEAVELKKAEKKIGADYLQALKQRPAEATKKS